MLDWCRFLLLYTTRVYVLRIFIFMLVSIGYRYIIVFDIIWVYIQYKDIHIFVLSPLYQYHY